MRVVAFRKRLFEYIDGKEPDIDEKAEAIGELVGKLHSLMKDYNKNLITRDKSFFIDRYIKQLQLKKYPKDKIVWYSSLGNEIWERVKDLPRGYCHGDLHRGNLLLTPDDKLYLFDFDTSCNAFPIFDIMVMCDTTNYFDFDLKGYDEATKIFHRFLKGYEKHCSLLESERDKFYDFIAIRHYQLQATIVEIYGLDCIDESFIDNQLYWLTEWERQCTHMTSSDIAGRKS